MIVMVAIGLAVLAAIITFNMFTTPPRQARMRHKLPPGTRYERVHHQISQRQSRRNACRTQARKQVKH
ncbi:hypothetical protein MTO96_044912 [Rhipicephalus appendiculatus]